MDNNKIIEQELIDKGFTEYKPTIFDRSADKFYQKRYRDGKNTKYFIDVTHYTIIHPTTKEDIGGYEVSGQYYLKGSHDAINMTFISSTVTEVEEFIDKLFEMGLLENYEEE